MKRRLVLLGGGHAHVKVLAALAARPLQGWDVHLVSPYPRQIYSGMLPGWIAGHYPIEACAVALGRLAQGVDAVFHQTAALGLYLDARTITCADGTSLGFDALSIDTGPVAATDALPGSASHGLAIRPIEGFIAAWPALVGRITHADRPFDLVVVGAGAAGLELSLAIHRRATIEGWSHLRLGLVGSGALPLPGMPPRLQHQAAAMLGERGITWQGEQRVTRIEANRIVLECGPSLHFDACLFATGAAAPRWPRAAGLATDDRGFIRVTPTLQSVSHPYVFAAGDVAAYASGRPKSGVYAVRAGPVLADNLRAWCLGRPLRDWTPQRNALYLLSTGDRHALASWGRWSSSGDWVWRWKDGIDRRFMRGCGTEI